MIFFLNKIFQLNIGWNSKPLTEKTFYKLCRRFKVKVIEMPLQVDGFYYCVKGRHYIALDNRLHGERRLFVMFHEFAHYLRHVPDTNATANFSGVGERSFKEEEADIFAYCALLPLKWVKNKTVRELHEDECFSLQTIQERKNIYEKYRI